MDSAGWIFLAIGLLGLLLTTGVALQVVTSIVLFSHAPRKRAPPERILCAALWVDDGVQRYHQPPNLRTGAVFCGFRHSECLAAAALAFPMGSAPEEELAGKNCGFLTSTGRFVGREEGALLAHRAGQLRRSTSSLTTEQLY